MTGSGTETNPYIVGTASELRDCMEDTNAYIKLGNSMDLRNEMPTWHTVVAHCAEIDFNGNHIKNVYVPATETCMIEVQNNIKIRNGKLLDVLFFGSQALFYKQDNTENNINFELMAISSKANNQTVFSKGASFDRCAINAVDYTSFDGRPLFDGVVNSCDINVKFRTNGGWGLMLDSVECRIQGTVAGLGTNGMFRSVNNCVIDVSTEGNRIADQIIGKNVYNATKAPNIFNYSTNLIACTEEEILNPTILNAKEFYVIPEER